MDLKNGMEELKKSKTFKEILRILKEIGNHLNSSNVSKIVLLKFIINVQYFTLKIGKRVSTRLFVQSSRSKGYCS